MGSVHGVTIVGRCSAILSPLLGMQAASSKHLSAARVRPGNPRAPLRATRPSFSNVFLPRPTSERARPRSVGSLTRPRSAVDVDMSTTRTYSRRKLPTCFAVVT